MKTILRYLKWNKVLGGIFLISIFVMHFYIYLDEASTDVPVLQNTTQTIAELKSFNLCFMEFPTYSKPLLKPTYTYCSLDKKVIISEQAPYYFKYGKMESIGGDISDYWQGEEIEGKCFLRSLADYTFPTPIFFLVQYILMICFLYFNFKS